jgi:hypothetical protein
MFSRKLVNISAFAAQSSWPYVFGSGGAERVVFQGWHGRIPSDPKNQL